MEKSELSEDVQKVVKDLRTKKKILAMIAPSFVVDFNYPDIVVTLKQMGIDKVCELTFGARIINKHYHKIIKKNPEKLYISSPCPVIVMMINSQYPQYKKNIIPVVSPMVSTARIIRKNYPNHKILFIAPCPAKKGEAKVYKKLIHNAITFRELKELIAYVEKNKLMKKKRIKRHLFDKFYADYTKIYPLSGGLSATLHKKDILKKDEVMVIEGPQKVKQLLSSKIPEKIKFLDILYCEGGCIGGPGVASTESIKKRHDRVMNYMKFARTEKIGTKRGLIRDTKGIKFNTPKKYIDNNDYIEIEVT